MSTSATLVRFVRTAIACSVIVMLMSMVFIVGWLLRGWWVAPSWTGATTVANTAACFLLCSVALLIRLVFSDSVWASRISIIMGSIAAIVGAATLIEHGTGIDFGIDHILTGPRPEILPNPALARMSPMTAVGFVLLGACITILDLPGMLLIAPAEFCAMATTAIGTLAVVGYLYDPGGLYDVAPFRTMAPHTATCFMILGIGSLFARSSRGIMSIISGPFIGSVLARRLLPPALFLPVALGGSWLWLESEQFINGRIGLSFYAAANIFILTILILWHARTLNQADAARLLNERMIQTRFEHEKVLVEEINHRVRNNLASLVGLLDVMREKRQSGPEFAQAFSSRIRTMASVHGLLSRSRWQPLDFEVLLSAIAATLPRTKGTLKWDGPKVAISSQQAAAVGMIFNELLTNSYRHGALAEATGAVHISWSVEQGEDPEPTLSIEWVERDGSIAVESLNPGVGLELVTGLVRHELSGSFQSHVEVGALIHRLTMQIDQLDATPQAELVQHQA